MTQIEQILCSLSLAWPSGGAQALRVLNQCNQFNLLTKKQNSRATNNQRCPVCDEKKVTPFFEFLGKCFYISMCNH